MFRREMATLVISIRLATTLGKNYYISDFHGTTFELYEVL